jgi:hemerythrin
MNLNWSDSYNSGIPEVDVQHQRFLALVQKLHNEEDESKQATLLKELYRYAVFHFSSEEELMRVYSYPDTEKQKERHKDLLMEFSSFVNTVTSSPNKEKFLYFLVKWFVDHTTGEDKDMGRFINSVRSF